MPPPGKNFDDPPRPSPKAVSGHVLAAGGTSLVQGTSVGVAPRSLNGGRMLVLGDSIELRALCASLEAHGMEIRRRGELELKTHEVTAQTWLVWLVDLGADGAVEQLSALLAQGHPTGPLLVALGRCQTGVAEPSLPGAMRFARPLDVSAIVKHLLIALERAREAQPKPAPAAEQEARPEGTEMHAEQSEVSAELAALLREAESRVEDSSSVDIVGLRPPGSEGSGGRPAEPVELGTDVWQALEEPLDDDELESQVQRDVPASVLPAEGSPPPVHLPSAHGERLWLPSSHPYPRQPGGAPSERIGDDAPDDRPTNASLNPRPMWTRPPPRMDDSTPEKPGDRDTKHPPAREQAGRRSGPADSLARSRSGFAAAGLNLPDVLIQGAAASVLAQAIVQRVSGCLVFEVDEGLRRVVLRGGDPVIATSAVHGESLVAFLGLRGNVSPEVSGQLEPRVPTAGRHAGADLIARGHLRQDDLWDVLKNHAIWVLGRIFGIERGAVRMEPTPQRLADEPEVFGGLTGAGLFVAVAKRTMDPAEVAAQLQKQGSVVMTGPNHALLSECQLSVDETALLQETAEQTLVEMLDRGAEELGCVLWALERLAVIELRSGGASAELPPTRSDDREPVSSTDIEAWQRQVRARRQLVDEGDYFALLGVARSASSYAIRAAYLELRRQFDVARAPRLDAGTESDLSLIAEVLEEAYEILRDQGRRTRYRRAIEARPS